MEVSGWTPDFPLHIFLFTLFYTYQMYLIPYGVDGQLNKEKYIMMMGARFSDKIVSLIGFDAPCTLWLVRWRTDQGDYKKHWKSLFWGGPYM
jgi:hypothetical protein